MSIFDNLKKPAPAADAAPASSTYVKEEGPKTFTFNALPESLAQLQALPEASLDSPFKTAALTVLALCAYAAAPEIGIEMINFLMGPEELSTYDKSFLKDRFMGNKYYKPFSYFAGTSPENDYTPSEPFTITIKTNPYSYQEDNYAVMKLKSSGADSERDVKCRRKGNQWFLHSQQLLPDIRIPKSQDKWA